MRGGWLVMKHMLSMVQGRQVRIQLKEGNRCAIGEVTSLNEEEVVVILSKETRKIPVDEIMKLEIFQDKKLQMDADFDQAFLLCKRVSIYEKGWLIEKDALIQLHEKDFIVVRGKCYDKEQYDIFTSFPNH